MNEQTYKALNSGYSVKQLLWSGEYDLHNICEVWAIRSNLKIMGMRQYYANHLEAGFKTASGKTFIASFTDTSGLVRESIEFVPEDEISDCLNPDL